MSDYEDYEYKECIRKGKKKPVYKKQKKYEAKVQKKNRIQPKTHKLQSEFHQENSNSILDTLIKVLKDCTIADWCSEYEDYYQNHHCYENEILVKQYEILQSNIIQEEYEEYEDDWYDRREWRYWGRDWR